MGKIITTELFVNGAKKIHGSKYLYSKTQYVNTKTQVIITCPDHGDFLQRPTNHLSGSGCDKCAKKNRAKKRKHTNEYFLTKVKEIHKDKYDYSRVIYNGIDKEVIIGCPIHGDFLQKAGIHLHGCGCTKCANDKLARERKNTTEEFIRRSRLVHGDKFDYSKVDYKNTHTNVIIICPIHGEFKQNPLNHSKGIGCSKCGGVGQSNTEEFIVKAQKIHGDKYDYSGVEYVKNRLPVKIRCKVHGDFHQKPAKHLSGHGCPFCYEKKKLTTEDFIKKAKEIHGDRFDYSKVKYINNQSKVIIICSIHGDFLQTPNIHLRGNGCSKCSGINNKKLTTTDFIERSSKIHNNFYDYSKTKYINSPTKVIVRCPEHGDFKITPNSHLQGRGCIKCNGHGFEYKPIEEVKKMIQSLGLTSGKKYKKWWEENKMFCLNNGIPKYPEEYYIRKP